MSISHIHPSLKRVWQLWRNSKQDQDDPSSDQAQRSAKSTRRKDILSHTHEFWAVRGAHINFYSSGVCATRQGTFTTSLRSSSSTLKVSHIFWAYVTERISTHSPNRKLKMQVSRAGRRLLCRWTAGCSLAHKNCTIALTHAARLAQLVCALAFNDFCVRTSMAGRRRSENSLLWHTYSKRHVKLCSGALYGIKSALGRVVCSRWKSRPDSSMRMVIVAQRKSGDALWSCFDPCDTPSAKDVNGTADRGRRTLFSSILLSTSISLAILLWDYFFMNDYRSALFAILAILLSQNWSWTFDLI